jgi:branched-chain amino acid transport system permease protein
VKIEWPPLYRQGLIWGGSALVLLLAPHLWSSGLGQAVLTQMGIAIIACLSYNLLFGQSGMLSFGHAVYSGLGAYLAMFALNQIGQGAWALPLSLVPLVGGLGGAGVALLFGYVSTRKAGLPFAMITLGLGELVAALALMLPALFGGEGGISGNRVVGEPVWGISFGPQIEVYYLVAAYCFICSAALYALTRTPLGRMLNAVRDNPQRVEFIGYDARWLRYLAFVIAGFFAGIAGGLATLHFEIVSPEALGAARSGAYLLFTYLGGSTVFLGPVLGAVLMVLALVLLSELSRAWLLYLGLIFIVMVMYAPDGLAGLMLRQWRLAADGRWRRLWAAYLALLGSGLSLLAGVALMIEMLYVRQLDATNGGTLQLWGLQLNSASADAWAGAALLLLTGAGLFDLTRRHLKREAP